MRSANSPISACTRRDRAAAAVAAPALLAAALWAAWPLPHLPNPDPAPGAPDHPTNHPTDAAEPPPFDRQAFAAAIWNPPPQPERPAELAAAPAPPPLPRLQLIGIAHDAGPDGLPVLRAALYNPDTDRLHILAAGERIGTVTILAVEPGLVRFDSGGRPGELRLRQENPGS
ncbi:MAG: hypothetical protein IT431_12835 [Phycisphaerales bacterium]|nr:hypothetical protein [Phycisphaerales bacterium]